MKVKTTVISVFLLLLTIGVQAKNVANTGTAGNADFEKAAEQFMTASLVISPVNASQAGFHKYTDPKTGKTVELDALLDDLGPSGIAEQKKFYSGWQQRFRK